MERAENILPFQLVTEKDVHAVELLREELYATRYWKEKIVRFKELVKDLSETSRWLLTFCVWFSAHNTRFVTLESTKYLTLAPAESTSVSLTDFIELIQQYNRKHVTHKNEIHLVRFLQQCDAKHFEFYMALLSKTFHVPLPKTEVYDILDVGSIDVEEIYGTIELLQTNLSELNFPVALTMLPDPDYKLVVQAREPKRTFSYYQYKGKLSSTRDLIELDAKYINTPRYTVIGYSDIKLIQNRKKKEKRTVIYPLDYFSTFREYRRYCKTKSDRVPYTPFKERIENLKKFLHENYLRQFVKSPIGYAENEGQLIQQITELYPREGNTFVIVTDNNTARTGKALAIPVSNSAGMIHGLWVEDGTPKGFTVWFNGHLNNIEFDFSGANNAILNNSKAFLNRMLEFTYMKTGKLEIFLSKGINWEKLQWRPYRHRSGAYIEKCVLCGSTEQPHKLDGLCRVCEINIRRYFDLYGPDNWIKPSRVMTLKRGKSGWSSKMLKVCRPSYRGHYVEAREDGYWRFVFDEERYKKYQQFLEKRANLTNDS